MTDSNNEIASPARRLPWGWIAINALVVLVAAAVVTVVLTSRKTFTLHGAISVTLRDVADAGGDCDVSKQPLLADLGEGSQVVVYDYTGKRVAAGRLGGGVVVGHSVAVPALGGTVTGQEWCRFPFTVTGVPAGLGSYTVQIGRHGKRSFTESQADKVEWTLNTV